MSQEAGPSNPIAPEAHLVSDPGMSDSSHSSSSTDNSSSDSSESTSSSSSSDVSGASNDKAAPVPDPDLLAIVPVDAGHDPNVDIEGGEEDDGGEEDQGDEGDAPHYSYMNVVSNLTASDIPRLRRRFAIPRDYKIIIPDEGDRMHLPPTHCRTFHVAHLEAGLRFPIHEGISNIISFLGLCPTQILPNSYRLLVSFVIMMRRFNHDPTFNNFWKLYYLTPSKKTEEEGFIISHLEKGASI